LFAAGLTGFGTGFSLILAIGAQNAFVLRQGLLRQHVFWLCLLFALSDGLLITVGVAGFGAMVVALPVLPKIMAVAGAAFLIIYGVIRLRAAWQGGNQIRTDGQASTLRSTLAIGLALTWANPHVYLDTLGLIGAVSTQYTGSDKTAFAVGAVSASFVFFFGLGYGARLVAPLMQSARAWQVFDTGVALVMWVIAAGLISNL